jgi:hypothetical protein
VFTVSKNPLLNKSKYAKKAVSYKDRVWSHKRFRISAKTCLSKGQDINKSTLVSEFKALQMRIPVENLWKSSECKRLIWELFRIHKKIPTDHNTREEIVIILASESSSQWTF